MPACPDCDGCGKVANTENREPWSAWAALPLQNAQAVILGFVRPVTCPRCGGEGRIGIHCDGCPCEAEG